MGVSIGFRPAVNGSGAGLSFNTDATCCMWRIISLDSWSSLRFIHVALLLQKYSSTLFLQKYSSSKDDRLLQRLQLACSGLEAGLQLRWLGAELKLHELLGLLPH